MRYRISRALPLAVLPFVIWACREGTTGPREAQAASLSTAGGEGGSASDKVRTSYTFSGDFAEFHGYDPATGSVLNVYVGQGGTPSAPQAWLSYDVGRCEVDPVTGWYTCFVREAGFGNIPTGDFTGNGNAGLRLTTDTRANPGFTVYAGTGGVIDLEWRRSGLSENRGNNVNESRFLDSRWKSNGSYSNSSASVQGTIVGANAAGGEGFSSGYMGSSHQHYTFMSR